MPDQPEEQEEALNGSARKGSGDARQENSHRKPASAQAARKNPNPANGRKISLKTGQTNSRNRESSRRRYLILGSPSR
jgi:hypothetical protein